MLLRSGTKKQKKKVKVGLVNSESIYEVYEIEALGSGLHPGKNFETPPEKLDIFLSCPQPMSSLLAH